MVIAIVRRHTGDYDKFADIYGNNPDQGRKSLRLG